MNFVKHFGAVASHGRALDSQAGRDLQSRPFICSIKQANLNPKDLPINTIGCSKKNHQ